MFGGHEQPTVVIEIVKGLEASLDDLVADTLDALGEDLPAYAAVPRDDLLASICRTVGIVVAAIRAGEPVVHAQDVDMAMVRRRVEQGVMPDAMVQSSRRVAAVVLDHVQTRGRSLGLPDSEVLALTNLVWAVTDAMGVRVSEAYRAIDIEITMRDAARRNRFLRRIFDERLSPVEVEQEAQVLGLKTQSTFRGIWVRPLEDMPDDMIEQVRRSIAAEVAVLGGAGLVGVDDGACIGLISTRTLPRLKGLHVVAGLGPDQSLVHAAESMSVARAICSAAVRRAAPGVFELPDVTWRVAVSQHPLVTETLRQRYLVPVLGEGDTRDTVRSLRAFLDADRHVQQAAAALRVHPNTLRYRLGRFEELTGRSLSSNEVIIELSWLLEAI